MAKKAKPKRINIANLPPKEQQKIAEQAVTQWTSQHGKITSLLSKKRPNHSKTFQLIRSVAPNATAKKLGQPAEEL